MNDRSKSERHRWTAAWLGGISAVSLIVVVLGGVVTRLSASGDAAGGAQLGSPERTVKAVLAERALLPARARADGASAAASHAPSATAVTPSQSASTSLPAGAGQDWWSVVQRDIAASEYHVTRQKQAGAAETAGPSSTVSTASTYQAPNRAQNLRTTFAPEGVTIAPRTGDGPSWQWRLALQSYGLGDVSREVEAATQVANGNRIEYRRGALIEWYVNDQRGVEQGFTIQFQPDSGQRGERLHLDLAVTGNVAPVLTDEGHAVDLIAEGGARVLRYAELKASDATGKEMPAWIELSGCIDEHETGQPCTLSLLADTAGAEWPITIDPLATSSSWTAESNQAGAEFGYSVASAGDVNGDGYADVIVGAPYFSNGQTSEGQAVLYHGSASGLTAIVAWTAEGDQANAWFGASVASAGDVNGDGYGDVIVGGYGYDNGETNEGRAFVYHGSASGLLGSASWTAESDRASAQFGYSVGSAGDVNGDGYSEVIVGVPNSDRAYVYHGSTSGVSASASWAAEDHVIGAFGIAVASAGDVNGDGYADVIVGASSFDVLGWVARHGAYVYHGSAAGLLEHTAWTSEDSYAANSSGVSVASAGDVNGDGYADVIIGAKGYSNDEIGEGRAFVYHGSASGLSASAAWTAEGNRLSARLGCSVASAGDVNGDGNADVVIGASKYEEGYAFVYYGSPSGVSTSPGWTAEGDQEGAWFGDAVASAGDVNGDGYADVIVGAHGYDNGSTDEGRAYVYHGGASLLAGSASWTAESNQASAQLGYSVASAGDVNGDGYADVIVGAPHFSNGQGSEGRAFVYQGSAAGLSVTASWTAEGDQVGAWFGYSVASAGDVNGDGYADVIVGAPTYTNDQTGEGRAFVYHGSAMGLSLTVAWTAETDQGKAGFGYSVALAGDVNGDGYADVIVGADPYDNGEKDEGRAFVYHGSASGLVASASWSAEGNQANARYGYSVASAGDVNGDGYADVIVGAYSYDNGETDEGRSFVYHGSASGLVASASWAGESNVTGAFFGYSVATAGDVNGDGYADVIVGSHYQKGRTSVFHGGASGLPSTASWSVEGDGYAYFGCSVASAGDVNGDGFADVIVGAVGYDNGESDEGRASVYHGSASGLPATATWFAEGNQAGAEFGYSVASAGDVNGDGFADVIVGAAKYDNPEADEGRAFVYYGNGGAGRQVLARQMRSSPFSGLTPAQPWASAGETNELGFEGWHSSPFGRARVKMQVEACPSGVPFGHFSCVTTTSPQWRDSSATASGTQLSESYAPYRLETLYHWRMRTLRAPFSVTQPGIMSPPNPAHGPWRRLMGQAFEADIRTGPKYVLNTTKSGSGTGVVTSSPDGIACGTSCRAAFMPGTLVTLTPTPNAASEFTGWHGACSGVGVCQVTMDSSRSVQATFLPPYVLAVSTTGAGNVNSSPLGIHCGQVGFDCAETYAPGTVVTLTPTAALGSAFAGWSGGGCSGVGPCQVTMSTAHHILAVFVPDSTASGFYPITPCRAFDTRLDSGDTAAAPVLAAGSRRDFSLIGKCGLPSGAKAISANLTVVGGAALGDLQVIGGHVPSTSTSQLSIPLTRARANNALVQLSNDGLRTISVINPTTGDVHFILDINGYFL